MQTLTRRPTCRSDWQAGPGVVGWRSTAPCAAAAGCDHAYQ